ncbi:MAG: NHL repeat-containing protein [Coriobacteriia bacterium]|nr:NHL repeat-containing protein [Coriobacteriia bacterium]
MSDTSYVEPGLDQSASSQQEYVSKRGRRILTALIIVLLLLLLLAGALLYQLLRVPDAPSVEETEGITWIRSIYGYGPDISQMIEPAAVSVADGGTFWVTDGVRGRVLSFNGSTGSLEAILQPGNIASWEDELRYPSSVAVAPDGWVYVAESTYNRVRAYDQNGDLQQTLEVPSPLSVTANNEMVLIGAESGFAAYTRDGEIIGIVGTKGQEEDQFDKVNGVALDDDNNAYVVDSFNNRISKYDAEGFLLWMVETGPGGNQSFGARPHSEELKELEEQYPALMQVPMGATLDGSGRLVVIDMLDFSIAAFDTEDGSFLGKWGTYGEADGMFMYPADISYDAAYDWFVIADSGNNRVQVIRLPDSGGQIEAPLRRALSGPLRACGFPLLVLLIILTVWAVMRRRDRSKRDRAALPDQAASNGVEITG